MLKTPLEMTLIIIISGLEDTRSLAKTAYSPSLPVHDWNKESGWYLWCL